MPCTITSRTSAAVGPPSGANWFGRAPPATAKIVRKLPRIRETLAKSMFYKVHRANGEPAGNRRDSTLKYSSYLPPKTLTFPAGKLKVFSVIELAQTVVWSC
jgi:hypothetical protein